MEMKSICIVCGILLLLAIPSWWPYGFYILLRWIMCAVSVYVAYGFYKSKLSGWSLIFCILALVFNPIVPVYLNKVSWIPIDLFGAVLFFVVAYSIKRK